MRWDEGYKPKIRHQNLKHLFGGTIEELSFHFQEHLMDFIVRQKGFWADDDDLVLKAIHEGFIQTHYAMWKELGEFSSHIVLLIRSI